jgi:hypothetical protein
MAALRSKNCGIALCCLFIFATSVLEGAFGLKFLAKKA